MVSVANVSQNNNPQMTFKAKKPNRKAIHEFIDRTNDLAMDIMHRDRPLEEKREIFMLRTLAKLKIKCPYVGNIVERGKAAIEHIQKSFNIKRK